MGRPTLSETAVPDMDHALPAPQKYSSLGTIIAGVSVFSFTPAAKRTRKIGAGQAAPENAAT